MKKRLMLLVLIVLLAICGFFYLYKRVNTTILEPINIDTTVTKESIPSFEHIAVIVMENKSYDDIVGNASAPYINSLIKQGSVATNYHAIAHPSLPNYLALIGGDTFGIISDCSDCYLNKNNLVNSFISANKSWRSYQEDMPTSCFIGSIGLYAQKHNPFIYFNDIKDNKDYCNNIVSYDELKTDISNSELPNFIWITPNLCHDMHDCSVTDGDNWLSANIPTLLQSSEFSSTNSVLIILWDEADLIESNKVAIIFIGRKVKQDFKIDIYYDHYSLLRTIEDAWGLPTLTTNDSNAKSMKDIFTQ